MRILSLAPLGGTGLDRLRALAEIEVDPWNAHIPIVLHAPDELCARLEGVDVLIVEADHVPATVIEGSGLRAIGVCRADPVNVDIGAATAARVPVLRAPGRNADAVAELTIGLILASLRGIVRADADIRAGDWVVEGRIAQQRFLGRELVGSRVGLVGFGAVGRATAWRLQALGAVAAAYDPAVPASEIAATGVAPVESLGELVEDADIISVHAPLTDQTRGMIDGSVLSRAKRGALFVNTARYAIADERALLQALRDGTLGGAALDHFTNEFLPPDHPLLELGTVILTPHIGGATRQTIENHTLTIARALEAVLGGDAPPELVNPEALR